ncbi:hypothetical protein FKM82_022722 [Ascaphus truei]
MPVTLTPNRHVAAVYSFDAACSPIHQHRLPKTLLNLPYPPPPPPAETSTGTTNMFRASSKQSPDCLTLYCTDGAKVLSADFITPSPSPFLLRLEIRFRASIHHQPWLLSTPPASFPLCTASISETPSPSCARDGCSPLSESRPKNSCVTSGFGAEIVHLFCERRQQTPLTVIV